MIIVGPGVVETELLVLNQGDDSVATRQEVTALEEHPCGSAPDPRRNSCSKLVDRHRLEVDTVGLAAVRKRSAALEAALHLRPTALVDEAL